MAGWRERVKRLKCEIDAIGLACRDQRVPWYTKVLAGAVVAYALSPIDLIPDFIPVLGYVDDLLLVPAGIALVLWLMPSDVIAEYRDRVQGPRTRANA